MDTATVIYGLPLLLHGPTSKATRPSRHVDSALEMRPRGFGYRGKHSTGAEAIGGSQHCNAFALVNNSCSAGLDRNRWCLRGQLFFNLLVILSRRRPRSRLWRGGVEAGSGVWGPAPCHRQQREPAKPNAVPWSWMMESELSAREGIQAQRAWRPSPTRRVPHQEAAPAARRPGHRAATRQTMGPRSARAGAMARESASPSPFFPVGGRREQ
jgi:hypothetical protein